MGGSEKAKGGASKVQERILSEGWQELGDLREMLIGQFMGILAGEGPMKYEQIGMKSVPARGRGVREDVPEYGWVSSGEGGVQIPIIAQAQEQQRRAASQAMRGTQEEMARTGLAGTPFGQMIEAQQRQAGAQAVQGVESNIIQQMLSMIPGYTQGQSTAIMGATPGLREQSSKGWSAQGPGLGFTFG